MTDLKQNSQDIFFNIVITPNAEEHFYKLIQQENSETNLRLVVQHPCTPKAEVTMMFCLKGDEQSTDRCIVCGKFSLFIEEDSLIALENAVIDYIADDMGGRLSIKAPHIKGKPPESDASLFDQISYVIQQDINPQLASHGGMVSLESISDNMEVFLRFGGGCHGCGMANVTLKQGIERNLMDKFPQIAAIIDVTDHAQGENPYYSSKQ